MMTNFKTFVGLKSLKLIMSICVHFSDFSRFIYPKDRFFELAHTIFHNSVMFRWRRNLEKKMMNGRNKYLYTISVTSGF